MLFWVVSSGPWVTISPAVRASRLQRLLCAIILPLEGADKHKGSEAGAVPHTGQPHHGCSPDEVWMWPLLARPPTLSLVTFSPTQLSPQSLLAAKMPGPTAVIAATRQERQVPAADRAGGGAVAGTAGPSDRRYSNSRYSGGGGGSSSGGSRSSSGGGCS